MIINNINGKFYIGSTVNFQQRCYEHLKRLRQNKHHSPMLQNSWNKYGEEYFIFNIVEEVSGASNLIEKEQFWIDCLHPKFNWGKVAGSPAGIKRSEKTKALLRKITLKQFKDKGHPCKGKKYGPEARENMSNAHKGKSLKEMGHNKKCVCSVCKTKRHEIIGNKHPNYGKRGKSLPEMGHKKRCMCSVCKASRHELVGNKNPNYKKQPSIEAIEKIRKKLLIPISQYSKTGEFIKNWDGAIIAAQELNLFATGINACLRGKLKTSGGFIWKYMEPLYE
jgi:group I intron endonuclease